MANGETEVAALDDLQITDLRREWRRFCGSEPPARASRDLLMRGVAYRVQERAQGGLGRSTRNRLRALARQLEAGTGTAFDPGIALKPGAKLVREWHGRTHTVAVLEDGFDYGGTRYSSLSVIARRITGARWSGPRFFGIRKAPAPFSSHRETDDG